MTNKQHELDKTELRVYKAAFRFVALSSFIFIFIILSGAYTRGELNFLLKSSESQPATGNCSNLTLKETAHCLRDYMETFYNYTPRSDVYRNIEDIKQNGGDCYDYAKVYEELATDLGFYASSIRVDKNSTAAHRFAVIANDEGYAILDQLTEPKLFYYKK